MFYKDKNKTIDKMFEYLKDSFFDNELLLFHDFNDLNLNYNFETKIVIDIIDCIIYCDKLKKYKNS